MALELYCGTGNPGKLREFQEAAGDEIIIRPCGPCDCPETGAVFEANAIEKALCYSESLPPDALLFVDDSGLVVDALDGAPGVYSARFAGEGATDEDNNRLLIEKLQSVENRAARYVCVIAVVRGGKVLATSESKAEGLIQDEPQGTNGFGYDPHFFFPETNCTFAQLTPAEKWPHSHRGKAFRKVLDWLREDGYL
jgi:XTP/dITP diphosphohydrolase